MSEQSQSKGHGVFRIIEGILYRKNYDPIGEMWFLVVPKQMRIDILREAHDSQMAGHLGVAKTYHQVKKKYCWPGLYIYVKQDRDGVTLKHCSMAYWLKVITALLIIGCIELNPGPKRQATLTNIPHSTPDQAPMDDLKLLIINLSAEVNRLGEKMDARLLNIEQKMEVWERRMAGIETSMASCTDALATNTRLISHNTLKIRNLEERAEALERRARENNLIIYGIESAETDSRELLLQKVKKLMAEDMQITDDVVIAECHRLGRGPKAPILIEVPDHESRISLLKNSFKLRMLNIFMSRDYSPQIREQRKILIEKRKELYKKGIGSKLRDNKLLLNGINYMVVEGQVMNAKGELI
ncbi:K02A2.6-like [Cordylochernes scorpioides]|uniref:K02A2.6-like n=1 Tax=Cordylochernes scorpioides TaxID=51811 RepID=A0ABY6L068_9ARAC|nr:K02A2.6-like [Cordylochernes scorpioides]